MPEPGHREGAPSHIHIERKKGFNWLPWLLLALGILALLFALSRCDDEAADAPVVAPVAAPDATAVAPAAAPAAVAGAGEREIIATTPNAPTSAAAGSTAGLASFLGGAEPTPRTFTFDTLNFETDKSAIRAADASEVNAVAATLNRYPSARVRIAGFADARGPAPYNKALGKSRADAIKAALVAKGIDGARIETVSGGETDPVGSNATADGRFENRRTELVVTAR